MLAGHVLLRLLSRCYSCAGRIERRKVLASNVIPAGLPPGGGERDGGSIVDDVSFGALLKEYRRARNLTHRELAERAQVSVRAISNLELGVNRRPRPATVTLLADGLRLAGAERDRFVATARGWRLPAARSPDGPHNLPGDLPEFIGRERDIAAVRALARRDRLVTLTGPGGTGKTRLALEAARGLLGDFPDGLWFVDLAPLRDPALVAATIAATLGIKETGNLSAEERLIARLRGRRSLLLLDNFEYLIAAAPLVAKLLACCATLTILTTSRVRLHLPGETHVLVPPLRLPDRRQRPTPGELAGYEAVALFLLRARFARQGVPLPADATATAGEICRLLDGLPLAIELAAARCIILSPAEVRDRLHDRLGLLSNGRRGPNARHQSLRAALAWSYDLLEPGARALFRRLAVFVGGCTLAAVEAVCDPGDDLGIAPLDGLQELAQHHLLRATITDDGETRYTMLETIREYALACLRESGEEAAVRQRHGDYCLGLAEQARASFGGLQKAAWLDTLERDHDNLRAAMRWFLDGGDTTRSLRLAAALIQFWNLHNHLVEGERVLKSVLASGGEYPLDSQAEVLLELGHHAMYRGEFTDAYTHLTRCRAAFERAANWEGLTRSLRSLGQLAHRAGDYPTAERRYHEALEFCRDRRDELGMALFLRQLGTLALEQGAYATARAVLEDSLGRLRRHGDTHYIALCLEELGNAAMYQRDHLAAGIAFDEALRLHRADRYPWGMAECLDGLGRLAWYGGDYATARRFLAEGLELRRTPPTYAWEVVESLESFAALASSERQPRRAARLWGAASAIHEAIKKPYSLAGKADFDRAMADACAMVGDAAWQAAWDAGRALSLDDAIVLALDAAEAE